MQTAKLDMYQAPVVAVIVLPIGRELVARIEFLRRYCIPAPVVDGLVLAIVHTVLRGTGIMEFGMDVTLQKVFMTAFFCSVGYMAAFGTLKKGGIGAILSPGISATICVIQDLVGAIGAKAPGPDPRIGLAMGSIPLVGGYGTASSWGPFLKNLDVTNTMTAAVAAATHGLVSGYMMGGPITYGKIKKFGLKSKGLNADGTKEAYPTTTVGVSADTVAFDEDNVLNAALYIAVVVGARTVVSSFIGKVLTMPACIDAMIVGAIIRSIQEARGVKMPMGGMNVPGNICLSLFLALAMCNLKLWQLVDLVVPMIIILLIETVTMWFYASTTVFNVMGRDYDATTISSGSCGSGMGATPNATANMQAIMNIYGPVSVAFMIVPLVGSLFTDSVNGLIITDFTGFLTSFFHL